jgi:hypothetical protein
MAQKGSLRRKAIGAGALGLVALGIWLGQYFPGFGLGKGLGFGTGSTDSSGSKTSPAGSSTERSGQPSATVATETPSARPATPPPQRLRVIIDGDRYILASGDEGIAGETLDPTEIAQRTKQAAGDDQGIRLRVERTKRATTGARQALLEAIDAAQIPRDALHESTEFIDSVN